MERLKKVKGPVKKVKMVKGPVKKRLKSNPKTHFSIYIVYVQPVYVQRCPSGLIYCFPASGAGSIPPIG